MLYIKINKLLSTGIILVLSFLGLGVYLGTLLATQKSVANSSFRVDHGLISNIAISCGSASNSTAPDGREWAGESGPGVILSGESRTSTLRLGKAENPIPVPYKTSRVSGTEFRYTFSVIPGQKIVRLHFYPASSYNGFHEKYWRDHFTVKAGVFTLLKNFSPSLASAGTSGVKYVVREFCMNVDEESQVLTLSFSPSLLNGKPSKKKKPYAFVNAIEIISMPTGLYYTAENELGARIVGLDSKFYVIDNSTALEVMHRLNIGGNSINSMEDFGLFRQWDDDTNYLLERPRARRVTHLPVKHKIPLETYVAPAKIYRTSWKVDTGIYHMFHQFTWKIPVDLGFRYLVRFHFCEPNNYRMMGEREQKRREFSIVINNQIAETKGDVNTWSNDGRIPVYKDYVVIMEEEDRQGTAFDILIGLQSFDDSAFGLLNGLEIFKFSDLENNLAAPSPNLVFVEGFSTPGKPEIDNLHKSFGLTSNDISAAVTLLTILLSILTYMLRKICEDRVNNEKKSVELASVKVLSCRCFSLADIMLATQDFSEAFIIGRGGFGKVYRGLIPGYLNMVAIKRLNKSFSKQGASEFWAEIETLSNLRHIHLVSLIGYCNDNPEMILVYEYISGGTLADNLYKFARNGKDCPTLSWEQRLKVCIGVARGLEYIHTSSQCGVIHRDIKDTNILLDENLVAKISDFGLSKLEQITESKSYVDTIVKGTVGYLDPDYRTTKRLTRKTDVYSFGIVMLVVLTGKPAVDKGNLGEKEENLLRTFEECMSNGGDVSRILDPRLQEEISSSSLNEFVRIIEDCLPLLPKRRPTMAQLVSRLEQTLEIHQYHHMDSSILVDATAFGHLSEEVNIHSLQGSHSKTKMLERSSVISPPSEANTGKQTQNLASTVTLGAKTKDSARLRKTLLFWPRKALWNRDSVKHSSPTSSKKDNKKLPSTPQEVEHFRGSSAANPLAVFTLNEVKVITNNFKRNHKLGEGGFGCVYKGFVPKDVKKGLQPIPVAIKVLSGSSSQGHREWLAEVMFLGQLSHPNLVKLIGYSCEGENRVLIYEYMAGGSVEENLFSSSLGPLSWSVRMKIAYGAAKGLAFLHKAERPVIFRDFKPSNILLDLEYNVKLSDFGLAKDGPDEDKTHVTTRVIGTYGYAAPEYIMTGHLSPTSDVYSYGVVLLELLTGKRALNRETTKQKVLTSWAMPLLRKKKKVASLMDPRLEGDYPVEDAYKVAMLAGNCLNQNPKERPLMQEIVDTLEPLQEG